MMQDLDRDRMRNVLNGFFLVILCLMAVFVGMAFNKVSLSRLRSRVEGIESRLQEVEERLPVAPAPTLMEGGAR